MPLAAKHMTCHRSQVIGAHRQFVFAHQSCQRWPELALLVGGILTYLAAALPPIPTGFWDKQPKATPGRLRRLLARLDFPKDYPFGPQLRKKRASPAIYPREWPLIDTQKPLLDAFELRFIPEQSVLLMCYLPDFSSGLLSILCLRKVKVDKVQFLFSPKNWSANVCITLYQWKRIDLPGKRAWLKEMSSSVGSAPNSARKMICQTVPWYLGE